MPLRFVDLDKPVSEYPDHVIRRVSPTLNEVLFCFVTLIAAGVCVVVAFHDTLALLFSLFTIIGLASVYATHQVHRERVRQRRTEFENAMFASALGKGYRFCLIARKDGMIVYRNPGFNALFEGKKDGYSLADWFEGASVSPSDSSNLRKVIDAEASAKVQLKLAGNDHKRLSVLLSVEPIDRPKGFMLLRGQEIPEQENG